tara:strand:+ start:1906 stop:2082 length:177 start_codon:yes stop_codon:yes gene_type:complete
MKYNNKSVMYRAWHDYKIKKAHKGYEQWSFAMSLYYAHRTIKSLNKNNNEKQNQKNVI